MSFNSLPNETIQRIVDLCHEADETYQKRVEDHAGVEQHLKNKGDLLKDPCKAWRGRSCSAMSMVNKRLRSMAIEYIFTTLRTSRSQEGIFGCAILGSATGDCIKYLVFDDSYADYLSAFVYNTLPLLPSLRSISGLSQAVSESMMLVKSIGLEDSSDIVEYISRKRAREAILRIAPQVTEWDMELDVIDAVLLLSKNCSGIESLSLASSECIGWDILESEESGFPRLLCKFPNLHTLAIHQTREAAESNLEIVHDSILSLSFPFATSLRTLSWDLERDDERTTPNEFAFATMFSNLESLRMRFRSEDLAEIDQGSSYLLPKLTSLEIVNCPFLHLHKLLHVFSLPSISSIHLSDVNIPFILPTSDEKNEEIRQLVLELGCYPSTLRSLRLQFPWKLPSLALDHLVALNSTIDVLVVPKPKLSRSGRGAGVLANLDEEESEENSDEERTEDETGVARAAERQRLFGGRREADKGFQATKELVDWAQERVYGCGTVDDVGLQEMRRYLEPMRDGSRIKKREET
ncbi:hypothetical protein JCM5353_000440 [Sporobolomyces roseus]